MYRHFRAATAAILFLGGISATPALASIVITNVQLPFGENITLHDGILGTGNSEGATAGQLVLTTTTGLLDTWCVDIFHTINIGGSYTYHSLPFLTDNSGTSPGTSNPLTASQINKIGFIAAYGDTLMSTTPSNDWSAAIQAEIWDIEYHTTATGSAGFMTALAALDILAASAPCCYGGYQIGNGTNQGQYVNQNLFVAGGPNGNPGVPEPLTIAIFGTALAGLRLSQRKKRG